MIVTGTVGCFLPGLQNLANGSTTLSTEHDVRAVADEIIAADNARDLNAVLRLYEVDAVLLPQTSRQLWAETQFAPAMRPCSSQ
jgi:ketosteroid isomerase-like protein